MKPSLQKNSALFFKHETDYYVAADNAFNINCNYREKFILKILQKIIPDLPAEAKCRNSGVTYKLSGKYSGHY